MKMMKKVASFVLAGAMTLSMSVAAFALTGVSSEEQKILDAAPAKAQELGVSTDSAQYKKYYSQAVTYVQQNDMTTTQVNGALTAMDDATAKAKAAMDKAGVNSLLDLDQATLKSLTSECAEIINKELDSVGIKVKVSADGSVVIEQTPVNAPDGSNTTTKPNTVLTTTNVIKQTGSDMTATVVVGAALVGAVAACGVVARKKGLFAKTEA